MRCLRPAIEERLEFLQCFTGSAFGVPFHVMDSIAERGLEEKAGVFVQVHSQDCGVCISAFRLDGCEVELRGQRLLFGRLLLFFGDAEELLLLFNGNHQQKVESAARLSVHRRKRDESVKTAFQVESDFFPKFSGGGGSSPLEKSELFVEVVFKLSVFALRPALFPGSLSQGAAYSFCKGRHLQTLTPETQDALRVRGQSRFGLFVCSPLKRNSEVLPVPVAAGQLQNSALARSGSEEEKSPVFEVHHGESAQRLHASVLVPQEGGFCLGDEAFFGGSPSQVLGCLRCRRNQTRLL